MSDENSAAPSGNETAGEEAPVDNLLALKLLVVSMGVLLIVAAVTFVLLLIFKGVGGDEEEMADVPVIMSTAEGGADAPESTVILAPGEEITGMALNDRSLALRLETANGERILIVDPYTADQKAVIRIERE